MKIGYKLAMQRDKKGLTQTEAAKLLGISRSSLSAYENDRNKVPLSVFIKMAYLYEFDVFEILRVNDPKNSIEESDINRLEQAHEWYWERRQERMLNELVPDGVIYLDDVTDKKS